MKEEILAKLASYSAEQLIQEYGFNKIKNTLQSTHIFIPKLNIFIAKDNKVFWSVYYQKHLDGINIKTIAEELQISHGVLKRIFTSLGLFVYTQSEYLYLSSLKQYVSRTDKGFWHTFIDRYEKGESIYKISLELKIDYNSLSKIMYSFGMDNKSSLYVVIPFLNNRILRTDFEFWGTYIDRYHSGESLKSLAKELQIDFYTLERVLKQNGLVTKNRGKMFEDRQKDICKTNKEKYGCDYGLQNKEIRKKGKETIKRLYGVEYVTQSPEIQRRIETTSLKKHGVRYHTQAKEVKEKIEKTNIKKYGTKCPLNSKQILEKIKQDCLDKYGVEHHGKRKDVREKTRQTIKEKYNVDSHMHLDMFREKIKQTNLKKYGCESHNQAENVKLKKKQTYRAKYGVDSPLQAKEIALKGVRKLALTKILKHWKTDEEVLCTASYEVKVVEYLNVNKIDFEWQPKVFKLSNGKTYRPDLYLIHENLWVEIKGYMRKDAQEKWNEFHTKIHSNSELWDKKKLITLGLLVK